MTFKKQQQTSWMHIISCFCKDDKVILLLDVSFKWKENEALHKANLEKGGSGNVQNFKNKMEAYEHTHFCFVPVRVDNSIYFRDIRFEGDCTQFIKLLAV